jgi:gamma-glutamylcysteine synthetase
VSSDSRWTGGLANREWQSGNRVEQHVDTDYIRVQVRRYLADCRMFDLTPDEDMCLKIVFHAGGAQKEAVRAAYREAVARATVPGVTSAVRPHWCTGECGDRRRSHPHMTDAEAHGQVDGG